MKLCVARIGLDDFVKANRQASRKEELQQHSRQCSMRPSVIRSKKNYSRKGKARFNIQEESL